MTAVGRPLAAGVALLAFLAAGWWAAQWRIGLGEPVATTVNWRFDGTVVHDITGDAWGTPARNDGVFSHTFNERGAYDYRCTLHGPMRGRVVVE